MLIAATLGAIGILVGILAWAAHADAPVTATATLVSRVSPITSDGVSHASVWSGQQVTISGRLVDAAGQPIASKQVDLQSRPLGSTGAWEVIGTGTTDAEGALWFHEHPLSDTSYRMSHPDDATLPSVDARPVTVEMAHPPYFGQPIVERLLVQPGDASAYVSWLPPNDPGGLTTSGYTITTMPTTTTTHVGPDVTSAHIFGLQNGTQYSVLVDVDTTTPGGSDYPSSRQTTPSADSPAPSSVPPNTTPLCGHLPAGVTTLDHAHSPYGVCPLGIVVGTDATLVFDASEGGITVQFGGPYGLIVAGGIVRTAGTSATNSVSLFGAPSPGSWEGLITAPEDSYRGYDASEVAANAVVDVSDVNISYGLEGLHISEGGLRLMADHVHVAHITYDGLFGEVPTTHVTDSEVDDVGSYGIVVGACTDQSVPCSSELTGSRVDGAKGIGIYGGTSGHATVRGNTVVNSGHGSPASPAAELSISSGVGTNEAFDAITGGGNAIDAVVLSGTSTKNLAWKSASAESATSPAPLGYIVKGLTFAPGTTMTVPSGGVVKFAACDGSASCFGPSLRFDNATLDATAGNAVFVDAQDNSTGMPICPSIYVKDCNGPFYGYPGIGEDGDEGALLLDHVTLRGTSVTADHVTLTNSSQADVQEVAIHGSSTLTNDTFTTIALPGAPSPRTLTVDGTGVTLSHLQLQGTALSITASGGSSSMQPDCTAVTQVSASDITISHVVGRALTLQGLCHPQVHHVSVLDSDNQQVGSPVLPPVVVYDSHASFGAGGDVSDIQGARNTNDGILFDSGTVVTNDIAWITAHNSDEIHPLGYEIANLTMFAPHTLSLGSGTTAQGGGIVLRGASLKMQNAKISPIGPGLVPACPSTGCGYGEIDMTGPTWDGSCACWSGSPGTLMMTKSAVHFASVLYGNGAGIPAGTAQVTASVIDSGLVIRTAATATVTGSRMERVFAEQTTHLTINDNTIEDQWGNAGGGITVTGPNTKVDASATPTDLQVKRNLLLDAFGPAIGLRHVRTTIGPGLAVDANRGEGAGASLVLDGVVLDSDLTWQNWSSSSTAHPLGYVIAPVLSLPDWAATTEGIDIVGQRRLVLPKGSVVKSSGAIRLQGGSVDGSAGRSQLLALGDDHAGPHLCSTDYYDTNNYLSGAICRKPYVAATIQVDPDPVTHRSGAVSLSTAASESPLAVNGSAASSVTVQLNKVHFMAPISVSGTATSLVQSEFDAGVLLQHSSSNIVTGNLFDGKGVNPGLVLVGAQANVQMNRIINTDSADYPAGLFVDSNSGGTFRCLDLRDNKRAGLRNDAPISLTYANLTSNDDGAYAGATDAIDNASLTTRHVYWGPGRALGPAPGQVSNPANLHDAKDSTLLLSACPGA